VKRPWQGQEEQLAPIVLPAYQRDCYLCPGNKRASGVANPEYDHTYVFMNDFQALMPEIMIMESRPETPEDGPFSKAEAVKGECRVLCFSPRHNLTLARMPTEGVCRVIDMWREQHSALNEKYAWVQVFENRGEAMGCSSPHPHGQVWSLDTLPEQLKKEQVQQLDYYHKNRRPLLLDYAQHELQTGERVVLQNEHWVVVVPYWAVWPFETLLLPRQALSTFSQITTVQQDALADVLKRLLVKYDNLFQTDFPYSMGWHAAPGRGHESLPTDYWQLHAHFYPPLLRSATVKKFMVGFELLCEPQRDLAAEQAAQRLRALPEKHFSIAENLE
jgi:UDPglucose--hexose-1-phosphate uridylyltransferase